MQLIQSMELVTVAKDGLNYGLNKKCSAGYINFEEE
jgi:hypothetical protein